MFVRFSSLPRRPVAAVLGTLLLAGCGKDSPSGPSANFDPVGQWQWRVTNATTSGASCSVTGVTITFSRSNGVLAGHRVATGGQNISCVINGNPTTASYTTNDALDNLTYARPAISFSFATSSGAWQMTGNVTGDHSMGGTAVIRLNFGGSIATLTGPWTATR